MDKMQKQGYITQKQLDEAKKEKLNFSESRVSIKAPDFVLYVKKYLTDIFFCTRMYFESVISWDWINQSYIAPLSSDIYYEIGRAHV